MMLIISTCKDALSEAEFVDPIIAIVGKAIVKRFDKVKPSDIDAASEIIISGTALADFDYLKTNWDWLKSCKKPILGICAGLQVLALAHGGRLISEEAIGVQQVTVTEVNPFCHGTFNAYFLHTKAVQGLEPLAVSGKRVVMAKVHGKEQYGVIFHPEVMNPELIKKFSGSVSFDSKL